MAISSHKIRPAARLIKTIGQDLVKDSYAAIVELVKNAYDADSPTAQIIFSYDEAQSRLLISVADCGDGMDLDTVVNKWLVPATDDKFRRKKSKNRRVLQGRKGIGRFAASILGERILLESSQDGVTTSLILDMDTLDKTEYLDQLELDVSCEYTGKSNGTILEIEKDNVRPNNVREIWSPKQLGKLLLELRSLLSPSEVYEAASAQGYQVDYDKFDVSLEFKSFPVENFNQVKIKVEPFPIVELFDYRIAGVVDDEGNAILEFSNQNIPGLPGEKINVKIPTDEAMLYPGRVFIDLRVYDRDPDSIQTLINRGLKDPSTGEYIGKRAARKILDESYGVGVYREQFRVRPYGDPDFDWLSLDKERVQKPSYKVGHNQVIGFVYIRPEELSGLEEKSARDGLVESSSYYGLIQVVNKALNELESRRFDYRERTQKGGRKKSIDETLDDLFNFDLMTAAIDKKLGASGISNKDIATIKEVVNDAVESEKKSKSNVVKKIRETIAIYQGQATLGKITHVLLHEGRKHIKYISETTPRVVKWCGSFPLKEDGKLLIKIKDRGDALLSHAKGLSYLFKKIEPLARTRRASPKKIDLNSIISSSFGIFSSEMSYYDISSNVDSDSDCFFVMANEVDLITVFSNLIENSVYWLSKSEEDDRGISIDISNDGDDFLIEYRDNGPGFQGDNLDLMFDPGYSMKPQGTGLGLALAGEAVTRAGGSIKALHSDNGALFNVRIKRANNV